MGSTAREADLHPRSTDEVPDEEEVQEEETDDVGVGKNVESDKVVR